jgi:hypothetical protein
VRASRRYVDPDLTKMPAGTTTLGERLTRHLFASPILAVTTTLGWLAADRATRFHKIATIEIPPAAPSPTLAP